MSTENVPQTQESFQKKYEYSVETRMNVEEVANILLSHEAAQHRDLRLVSSLYDPNKYKHEQPIETLINAADAKTNTSFIVERSPSILNAKATMMNTKLKTYWTD